MKTWNWVKGTPLLGLITAGEGEKMGFPAVVMGRKGQERNQRKNTVVPDTIGTTRADVVMHGMDELFAIPMREFVHYLCFGKVRICTHR